MNYDKYAIVYGISDYPGTANDLSYCDEDALGMESLFLEQGYPSSNIYLEIDGTATRANL
ncbi:MAG: caspase family protein, partial [Spirochaetia bacterium]